MIFYTLAIILSITAISLLNMFFGTNLTLNSWQIVFCVILDTITVILIDGLIAFIISRSPDKWFNHQIKLFNASKTEQKFYEKLGIKKWKDKVVELGSLNHFSKAKILEPKSNEYLNQFLIEANKGILIHIISMIFGFSIIFFLPLSCALNFGVPVAIVNLILNLMPTMILRYNNPKILTMIKYNEKHNKLVTEMNTKIEVENNEKSQDK